MIFHGRVISVSSPDWVFCELHDQTTPENPIEVAEIRADCFSRAVEEGDTFVWTIDPSQNASSIEVNQPYVLTEEDITRIKARARSISLALGTGE